MSGITAESDGEDRLMRALDWAVRVVPVVALVLVCAFVLLGDSWTRPTTARVVDSRDLVFTVRADDAMVITDPVRGRTVDVLPNKMEGFIATTIRGLERGRRARAIAGNPAYRLTRYDDGRLVLTDTAIGTDIELVGFGQTNFSAFANLLTLRRNEP